MFDVGFSEMVLTGLVALVVLGPEKLPKVARWVGRFTGQAKAYMQSLSAELEREGHLADLKRQLAETERLAREHADQINRSVMNASHDALPAPVMTALPAPAPAATDAPAPSAAAPIDVEVVSAEPRVPLGRQPDTWRAEQAATGEGPSPAETVAPLASLPPATGAAPPPAGGGAA